MSDKIKYFELYIINETTFDNSTTFFIDLIRGRERDQFIIL